VEELEFLLEFLRESIPDPEEPSMMACEYDVMERIFELYSCRNSCSLADSRSWRAHFAGQRRRSAEGSQGNTTEHVA
jgi:hypothetical protein